jgi:tRNA 2-thiouridine synthesizing protein A
MPEQLEPSRTVDARGLRCPLPLIRAREEMELVPPGGVLQVYATDPGAEHDLKAWSKRKGYTFVDVSEPGNLCYLIYRA